MSLSEAHDSIFFRDRLVDALDVLQSLAKKIRQNNQVNSSFDESTHKALLDVASGAAAVFQNDLNSLSVGNELSFVPERASDFLGFVYEVCAWFEVGMPEQAHFLAELKELIQEFIGFYPSIFEESGAATSRVSSPMCGPYDGLAQIGEIKVPDSVVAKISREPLVHMRSRLYAAELNRVQSSFLVLENQVRAVESKIETLRTGLDESFKAHETALISKTNSLLKGVTDSVSANALATKTIEDNSKLLGRLLKAKAEDELTKHYKGFTTVNQVIYGLLFGLAIACFMAAAIFGASITLQRIGPLFPDDQGLVRDDFLVAESIGRLVVVSGLAGLGTFFAKQAGQYRKLSHWASSIAMQLNTFEAYVKDISDPSHKDQLRTEFARRVFGQEPGGDASGMADGGSSASLLPALAETIRTLSKPSDKA